MTGIRAGAGPIPSGRIVYDRRVVGAAIAYMDVATRTETVLATCSSIWNAFEPQWSPDGRWLIWYGNCPSPSPGVSLVLMEVDGTGFFSVNCAGDSVSPVCTSATASPPFLWPPTHKLVPVQIIGISDPDDDQSPSRFSR